MVFSGLLVSFVAIDQPPDPTTEDAIVAANNKFSLEYFKACYDEKCNSVVSPYHVRLSLSMFYPLAGAAVQEDFQVAFGLPQEIQAVVEQQARLATQLHDGQHLKALSFVLVEETLPLGDEFKRLFMETFQTTVEPVDLTDDIPSALAVNSFYQRAQTEIEDFIGEGDVFSLPPCFKLMLFSGVSVLTPLALRFNATDTVMEVFQFVNAPTQRVPMMHAKAFVRRCQHNELMCTVVEVPFNAASGLSMLVLLPYEGTELLKTVTGITQVHLTQIDERLQHTWTDLKLPKFFVREKTDPKTVLGKLGYGGVFEIDDLRVFRDTGRTRLNGFFQHCYIATNETGGELPVLGSETPTECSFHANRPFAFLVRRTLDGNVLQLGNYSKYIDPDEQF
ncbi:serpin I2-like [Anopheles maculipalpis]|uniref:serpin I2-like n=1 Tax=Anopheles maculipalpis TaxID=1496333 RepID=UPI0021594A1B|nr:serpin I2-like [Anopheles maculipalpis]